MSHVKAIKTIQQVTRAKVMQLLGWNDLQYGEFQMQQADAYIARQIGDDVWGVQQLKEAPAFWAWWRNHWHRRDEQFIGEVKNLTQPEMVMLYEITHDAEAIEYTPHFVVMQHAFQRQVIDEVCNVAKQKKERKVSI
ncbi:hypothetical protein [Mucilaginibacter sp. L3T2-6]|uniref:hypothetical protein n=1 Tax=Mucilaginibacter sp. L3T2-6 TaxID=3062491 RepID=UPI0026743C6D|nr:hypothetical protein [Mucilaginibacter sp. L3T2-6]MDO3641946.1 hypothetical protein [Mucilaginibacter sp. L3T2-6]MDV6214376.1 hypothetical protein [Mucilaginibacter sp. L3T2-6]